MTTASASFGIYCSADCLQPCTSKQKPDTRRTTMHAHPRSFLLVLIAASALALSGCETVKGWGQKIGIGGGKVTLSGGQEVPPVKTDASGSAEIKVASDKSVSGSVTTNGVNGVAAHSHQGAAGRNGP